jgi:hypothetical protein
MKKDIPPDDDQMPAEFDFSKSRPNPFWLGMVDRRCVRVLASDLAEAFPNDDAVNETLRASLRTKAKQERDKK